MSQALEESMRMYEEENRRAPPDESLAVRFTCSGDCWLHITLSRSWHCHLKLHIANTQMLSVACFDDACNHNSS